MISKNLIENGAKLFINDLKVSRKQIEKEFRYEAMKKIGSASHFLIGLVLMAVFIVLFILQPIDTLFFLVYPVAFICLINYY